MNNIFKGPILLNIITHRKFWHAGAGTDGEVFDRMNGIDISEELKYVEQLWQSRLEIK